jgi:hypothetical protein
MGLWKRIRDSMRQGKERDQEVEREAAIDRMLKEQDRLHREQGRSPRLPPRGDRG